MLFVLVVVVVAIVLTPVFLIMPFKAQTPRTMEVSYLMRRWSPLVTILGLLAILTLTIGLWFGGRWWSRAVMLILLVPALGATWLARRIISSGCSIHSRIPLTQGSLRLRS
jgi:hypothetical protein